MIYTTWYDFKKDFERQLGHCLLNWDWLKVKPKAPLPWNESHLKTALTEVSRFKRADGCARKEKERVMRKGRYSRRRFIANVN